MIRVDCALQALDRTTRNALLQRTALADATGAAGSPAGAVAAGASRQVTDADTVRQRTRDIIARVRDNGDDALREMAHSFDGVTLQSLEVPRADWTRALDRIDAPLRHAMERAARNIDTVHRAFRPEAVEVEPEPGITVGRRPDPLARVGVYAPGGRAAYPSSLLMGAIPARVAGVGEIVVCSPPSPSGVPSDVVLAAAAIAQADRVFALGGAGAIAAMALGTQSVPRVDRIVGPGNAYVAEAKMQLVSQVAIDSPAGPSELLVIADGSASPDIVAREMVAQAEHDPDTAVITVVVGDEATVRPIRTALQQAVDRAPRQAIVREALTARGALLWVPTMDEAIEFANAWAAEHLLIAVHETQRDAVLSKLRNAGTVFVGEHASVAFGDYMTGANHVLPTAGLARCYSGLSTLDFVRWTTWQRVTPTAAASLAHDVGIFADAEGLPGHADAARAHAGANANANANANVNARANETMSSTATPLVNTARASLPAFRAAYREVPLYDPKRAPVALDLTDNTNLWGLPPNTERVMRTVDPSVITRYPSLYAGELKDELARFVGVSSDMLVTGCGSDDMLDSAMRAFADPSDRVASSVPSFAMVPIFSRMNALQWIGVTEQPDHSVNVEALLATHPRVLYLCTPNNPTGAVTPLDTVRTLSERTRGVVIVDEAYIEFCGQSSVDLVGDYPNLLVVRTLSKAFGLAGLRVGYAIGHPELVREVEKSRGPYKVNALAERMAITALREDMPWVRDRITESVALRERLAQALTERGFAPLPSGANFVCAPVPSAVDVGAAMRAQGVAVRPFPDLPHIGDALRFSVGPWPLLERCLGAFDHAVRTLGITGASRT